MLGAATPKKSQGAELDKNMLQAALGKNICFGLSQLKKSQKTAWSCVR